MARKGEIFAGGLYLTRVSGRRVLVRVVSSHGNCFRLQRRDNGRMLPKARRAAALSLTVGSHCGAYSVPALCTGLRALCGAPGNIERVPKPPRKQRRRAPKEPPEPHCMVSCREFAARLRSYVDATDSYHGLPIPAGARRAYIRLRLRRHLQARALYLAVQSGRIGTSMFREACDLERAKVTCSFDAVGIPGTDPLIAQAMITLLRERS